LRRALAAAMAALASDEGLPPSFNEGLLERFCRVDNFITCLGAEVWEGGGGGGGAAGLMAERDAGGRERDEDDGCEREPAGLARGIASK